MTADGYDEVYVPMVTGYRYDELGSSCEGYKEYVNPATKSVLFGLTGFKLHQSADKGHDYAFLIFCVDVEVLVALPTERPIPELVSFDYSHAANEAKVEISIAF